MGILLARYLGPEGRGAYALVILTVILLTLISNFGITNATIYYVGTKAFPAKEILITSLLQAIISSLFVAIIIIALMNSPWKRFFWASNQSIYLLGLIALVPQAIRTQIQHFLLGLKNVVVYNRLMTLDIFLLLSNLIIFVLILDLGLKGALISYINASFITLLVNLWVVQDYLSKIHLSKINLVFLKKAFRLGSQFFATGLGGFGIQRLNFLLLEIFHSATTVGLYAVASALPTLFLIIPSQLATVLYPWVTNAKDKTTKIRLTTLTIKGSLYICLVLMIPLSLLMQPIIVFLYGMDYQKTYLAALILLVGMLFSGIAGVIVNYLAGIGKPKYGVYLTVINIAGLMLFGYIFIPTGNIEGAALAKTTSEFISITYLLVVFIKYTNVPIKNLFLVTRKELLEMNQQILTLFRKQQ